MRHNRRFMAPVLALCLTVLILSALLFSACVPGDSAAPTSNFSSMERIKETGSLLRVHFLDVGQGDCALITFDEEAMLIDAGPASAGDTVLRYLEDQGIKHLKYVVATHPHEDHIGSMDRVLSTFQVDTLIMPKMTADTRTFEAMLTVINEKSIKVTAPAAGAQYKLGDAAITLLGPVREDYEDLNNCSVVLKLEYGKSAFLFTGDAEAEAEADLLASGADVSAQVLKVGHHGSSTSTSDAFLKAVSPSYAVLSVGAGNSYGHPDSKTLQKLKAAGCTVLRTDLEKTVVLESDGSGVSYVQDTPEDPAQPSDTAVILNKNSKVYHLPSCANLPAEKNRQYLTLEEARAQGGKPCSNCFTGSGGF